MDLTFKDLKNREVVNIVDGSSFGNVVDLTLTFPTGKLISITVSGSGGGFFSRLFGKTRTVIDESNIIKIGGDVILVNVKCGESCESSVNLNPLPTPPKSRPKPPPNCPPHSPCPPPCPPSYPNYNGGNTGGDIPFGGRIDLDDYT